jgi:hypothetical protein
MAGLLDQYTLMGNMHALDMLMAMTKYFNKRVEAVINQFTIERHWRSLNEETGGMNDVLYRLYRITVSPHTCPLLFLQRKTLKLLFAKCLRVKEY